jgi:hypothetical protein
MRMAAFGTDSKRTAYCRRDGDTRNHSTWAKVSTDLVKLAVLRLDACTIPSIYFCSLFGLLRKGANHVRRLIMLDELLT